jgi:hypothetical protein
MRAKCGPESLNERIHLDDLGVDGIFDVREIFWGCGLDSSGSR